MKLEDQTESWRKLTKRLECPFFYYDLDFLSSHLQTMADGLKQRNLHQVKFWYACKANPLSAILKIFRNLDFGIDIASLGELRQVLAVGIEPQEIIATGPAKSKEYLRSLLKNEVETIVLESLNQAYWLNELAHEYNLKPKVLLRLQLSFDGGHSVLGGNSITPFGLTPETWEMADRSRMDRLDILGIHAFQWGNLLDINRLKTIWWKTTQEALSISQKMNLPLKVLDLGGGLGVPYEPSQKALPFEQVADLLKELIEHFNLESVWMELGRYSVAECGVYMAPIVDRKSTREIEILVLEGGINHIARPALTNESFPAFAYRPHHQWENSPLKTFQIHGPLCTALDLLGTFELPADLAPGDWIGFQKVGAYGFTEAMPFFLCHDLPAEVIKYRDDLVTPRAPKTSTDWMV